MFLWLCTEWKKTLFWKKSAHKMCPTWRCLSMCISYSSVQKWCPERMSNNEAFVPLMCIAWYKWPLTILCTICCVTDVHWQRVCWIWFDFCEITYFWLWSYFCKYVTQNIGIKCLQCPNWCYLWNSISLLTYPGSWLVSILTLKQNYWRILIGKFPVLGSDYLTS